MFLTNLGSFGIGGLGNLGLLVRLVRESRQVEKPIGTWSTKTAHLASPFADSVNDFMGFYGRSRARPDQQQQQPYQLFLSPLALFIIGPVIFGFKDENDLILIPRSRETKTWRCPSRILSASPYFKGRPLHYGSKLYEIQALNIMDENLCPTSSGYGSQ